jgi:hypothetical protein
VILKKTKKHTESNMLLNLPEEFSPASPAMVELPSSRSSFHSAAERAVLFCSQNTSAELRVLQMILLNRIAAVAWLSRMHTYA